MTTSPVITLNDENVMPQLGFGTYKMSEEQAEQAVGTALQAGYRLIDTATFYENEAGVGRAIARSQVPREKIFVTTKVWNTDQGRDATLRSFDASLKWLGLEYLDLLLIHWPAPERGLYLETWRTLVELKETERVRSIGVSNFTKQHLQEIIDDTDVTPVVNQIELHPYLVQKELRQFHISRAIRTQAWSPLARGQELLHDPVIVEMTTRGKITASQVVLAWHLQLGNSAIPKSVTPARIVENLDAVTKTVADKDITAITALNRNLRLGPDPEVFS